MCRILQFSLLAILVGSVNANASTTSLADWCVNLNGDITTACNFGGSGGASGTGSISLAGFDTTTEPGTNTLGSVVVTLGVGKNQYAAFYADYDLDFGTLGSFQDSASVNWPKPLPISYEADDPNSPTSTIFSDFAANTLTSANNVGAASVPPNACCDVAFALAVRGITVSGAGDTDTVTFTVSDVAPTPTADPSGFYIQQTNFDVGDSIYLYYTDSGCQGPNCIPQPPPTGVPEPSTFGLGLSVVGGLLLWARRRAA